MVGVKKEAAGEGTAGAPAPWTLEEYVTASGRNLALAFLKGLGGTDRAEAIALLKLLRERGNQLGMPHAKPLGSGLFELRGHQVRVFYTFRPGRRITLLDGMVKKRGAIPPGTLARVRGFLAEVKAMDPEVASGPGPPKG